MWFYFSLFNMFRPWPIKTDFVLTTLATRQQSKIFPQHIAPETPCSFPFVYMFLSKKGKQKKYGKHRSKDKDAKTCLIPRIIFSVNTKCKCHPSCEAQEIKKRKNNNMCFSLLIIMCHFFSCASFLACIFISFQFMFFFVMSFHVRFFVSEKKTLPIQTTGMLTHYLVLLIKNIFLGKL